MNFSSVSSQKVLWYWLTKITEFPQLYEAYEKAAEVSSSQTINILLQVRYLNRNNDNNNNDNVTWATHGFCNLQCESNTICFVKYWQKHIGWCLGTNLSYKYALLSSYIPVHNYLLDLSHFNPKQIIHKLPLNTMQYRTHKVLEHNWLLQAHYHL